jgi:purine-binding chemotaxis protein CheW
VLDPRDTWRHLVAHNARKAGLLRLRFFQNQHTMDQLSAALRELAELTAERAADVPVAPNAGQERNQPMTTATLPTSAPSATAGVGFADEQVVVLRVRGGDYAVHIGRVQEIVRVPQITRVPNAPEGVQGIINLRGRVLPVIDLASRLGLGTSERGKQARVVVVENGAEPVGLLVDGVSEVLRLDTNSVEQLSQAATEGGHSSVRGIARVDDRLVLLLDLDALV